MIHLNALTCSRKETLMHGVHSHGHIIAIRVPVTIRASRLCRVRLRLHPRLLTILLYHGSPTLATHLQGDTVGVGAIGCMTVEATTGHNRLCQDSIFIKGMDIPLVYTDIATHLIARFDTTVGQTPIIKRVLTDTNREILILFPLSFFLHTNGNGQFAPDVLFGKRMPVGYIEISPSAIYMQFPSFATLNDHIHTFNILISNVEVQGSDTGRNGYTDVIRIDLWQRIYLRNVLHLVRTS